MNNPEAPTGAAYRAAQKHEGWPEARCPYAEHGHRFHVWRSEPGDGFRYSYWCNGDERTAV